MKGDTVEQIKERLNILDVISSYIEVTKAGSSFKAKCPFHNEKTPSFHISPERGTYYCFGCGAKGDVFSFVQAFEGLDFKGALKILAEKAGVPLISKRPSDAFLEKEKKEEKDILLEVMEKSGDFFESNLYSEKGSIALDYLLKRGLKRQTIKEFRLGYALDDWRSLYEYLKKIGYSDKIIEKAGLIKISNGKLYDRFRNRVMFPINDTSGRIIAFTGRILGSDEGVAKYLNSPETPLFQKSNVLYGLDKSKQFIRQKGYSILVEGQVDLIVSFQAGFKNIVAGSGTALTSDGSLNKEEIPNSNTDQNELFVNNFGILKRLSPNILLIYDGDEAGRKAAERSAKICLSLGMDTKVAFMPLDTDPADLILQDVSKWKEVLKDSKHAILFVLDLVIDESNQDMRKISKGIFSRVLPLVLKIQSNSERAHFVKIIKEKSGIKEEALWQDLNFLDKKEKQDQIKNTVQGGYKNTSEPNVKKYLSSKKEIILKKIIGIFSFKIAKAKDHKILDNIRDGVERITQRSFDEIIRDSASEIDRASFEAESLHLDDNELNKEISNLMLILEEEELRDNLKLKSKELFEAEKNKNRLAQDTVSKEIQLILKKISDLQKTQKNSKV